MAVAAKGCDESRMLLWPSKDGTNMSLLKKLRANEAARSDAECMMAG